MPGGGFREEQSIHTPSTRLAPRQVVIATLNTSRSGERAAEALSPLDVTRRENPTVARVATLILRFRNGASGAT
jgi:hypothetical protein